MVEAPRVSPMIDVGRPLAGVLLVTSLAMPVNAAPPPLVCSGGEPSWRLEIDPRRARLSSPWAPDVSLLGRFSSLDALKAHAWRGRPAVGAGGEVVAFVSEAACRDASTGETRPFTVRVSLPDGRFLAGCCRLATEPAAGEPTQPGPLPVPAPTPAPSTGDWTASLVTFFPAIKACVSERKQTEAVVFAAVRPDKVVHLLLRLPGDRYADCNLPAGRGPAKIRLRPKGAALAAEEEAAVLTLLPHEPPSGGCFRSQSVVDEQDKPLGWISRKGC